MDRSEHELSAGQGWHRPVGVLQVPLLIVAIILVDISFGVIYLGNRVLGSPLGYEVSRLFDLDGERNVPTWYSSMKLLLVAVLLFVAGSVFRQRRLPRAWIVLALATGFAAMSLDEFAGMHERLSWVLDRLLPDGTRRGTPFRRTGIWMFALGVPAVIGLLWMVHATRRLWNNARATWIFAAGVIVFIGSAAGLEILANFTSGRMRWLQITAEECGEMLGVTIALWATYELLASHGIRLVSTQPPRDTVTRRPAAVAGGAAPDDGATP